MRLTVIGDRDALTGVGRTANQRPEPGARFSDRQSVTHVQNCTLHTSSEVGSVEIRTR